MLLQLNVVTGQIILLNIHLVKWVMHDADWTI